MNQPRLIIGLIACVLGLSLSAKAQQPEQVHVVLKNLDELYADLQHIVSLDKKRGTKQWPNIQGFLDLFSEGIDRKEPLRFDYLLSTNPQVMRFALPVLGAPKKLDVKGAFVGNIKGWIAGNARGAAKIIQVKPRAKGEPPVYIEWNNLTPKVTYAFVSEDRKSLRDLAPDPRKDVQPALATGADVIGYVSNTADGQMGRRRAIQDLRKEILAVLKPLKGESDDEFDVRKLATTHQLDELERVYAEVQTLILSWTTDVPNSQGLLEMEVTGLPGTQLEESIKELGAKASLFGGRVKSKNSIFFGRINHALDSMRRKNIAAVLDGLQGLADKRVDGKDYSAEKKAALTKAIAGFIGMLKAGNEMGVIDGFVDVTATDGKRSAVGGIRVADGKALVAVLESLKTAGWKIEINTSEGEDGSAWHAIEFPDDKEIAHALGGTQVTVVTTANSVLYATGADAKDKLNAVLELLKKPADVDGIVIETYTVLAPWIDYLNERRARKDKSVDLSKLSDKEKRERKESEDIRNTASSAFGDGADIIHTTFVRKGNKLVGNTTVGTGVLRFVGMMMSSFAEKNLQ